MALRPASVHHNGPSVLTGETAGRVTSYQPRGGFAEFAGVSDVFVRQAERHVGRTAVVIDVPASSAEAQFTRVGGNQAAAYPPRSRVDRKNVADARMPLSPVEPQSVAPVRDGLIGQG